MTGKPLPNVPESPLSFHPINEAKELVSDELTRLSEFVLMTVADDPVPTFELVQ